MTKIFVAMLLILFTVQPLIPQVLTFKNSDLNVMMSTRSDVLIDQTIKNQKQKRNRIYRYALITSLSLGIIGGSIGSNQPTEYAAGAIANTMLGATIGVISGTILGIIWANSTDKNPTGKKLDRLKKLDRYDPPKSVDINVVDQIIKEPDDEIIKVGQTKNEIIEIMGKAASERFLTTRSKTNYGAEKEFWNEIEIGTELELWSYDLIEGKLNLYFFKGTTVLNFKAFNPKK